MATDLRTWQFGSRVLWDNDAPLPAGTTFVRVTGGTGWTAGRYPLTATGVQVLNLGAPDGVRSVASLTKPPAGTGTTGGAGSAVVDGIRLIFDGNSLTAGYGIVSPADFYPEQCVEVLGADYAQTPYGVAGQATPQMAADAATQIDPLFVADTQDILVAWEIGNDLDLNAAAASAAVTTFINYCAGRKAAGFRVVVLTVTPRNAINVGTVANWNARRVVANALVTDAFGEETGYARVYGPAPGTTWADMLVDVAANPLLTNYANLTYYQADTVHLTAAGAGAVAADVANGVRALDPPPPVPPAPTTPAAILLCT